MIYSIVKKKSHRPITVSNYKYINYLFIIYRYDLINFIDKNLMILIMFISDQIPIVFSMVLILFFLLTKVQIFYTVHCYYNAELDNVAFSGIIAEIYTSLYFMIAALTAPQVNGEKVIDLNLMVYLFLLPFVVRLSLQLMRYRLNQIVLMDFESIKSIQIMDKKIKLIYYNLQ